MTNDDKNKNKKMVVKFRAQLIKTGNSFGFVVPKAFVDSDIITRNNDYEVEVKIK